jgi:hypothetical protein
MVRYPHNIFTLTNITLTKENMSAVNVKGDEVTFIKGKYVGYKGWINATGDETAISVPVIVHGWKKADGSTVDRVTNVRKSSVRKGSPPQPNTRAEAIMLQMPRIEAAMDSLCRQLAKCELDLNSKSIHIIFARKLQEATANQIAQGSKATWYRINESVENKKRKA